MDRNALAELLQALESRRDAEERRREERYTALIERVGLAVAAATTPTTTPMIMQDNNVEASTSISQLLRESYLEESRIHQRHSEVSRSEATSHEPYYGTITGKSEEQVGQEEFQDLSAFLSQEELDKSVNLARQAITHSPTEEKKEMQALGNNPTTVVSNPYKAPPNKQLPSCTAMTPERQTFLSFRHDNVIKSTKGSRESSQGPRKQVINSPYGTECHNKKEFLNKAADFIEELSSLFKANSSKRIRPKACKGHRSRYQVKSQLESSVYPFTTNDRERPVLAIDDQLDIEEETYSEEPETFQQDNQEEQQEQEKEQQEESTETGAKESSSPELSSESFPTEEPIGEPPRFTQKLKSREVPEGSKVQLDCIVTGIPAPEISTGAHEGSIAATCGGNSCRDASTVGALLYLLYSWPKGPWPVTAKAVCVPLQVPPGFCPGPALGSLQFVAAYRRPSAALRLPAQGDAVRRPAVMVRHPTGGARTSTAMVESTGGNCASPSAPTPFRRPAGLHVLRCSAPMPVHAVPRSPCPRRSRPSPPFSMPHLDLRCPQPQVKVGSVPEQVLEVELGQGQGEEPGHLALQVRESLACLLYLALLLLFEGDCGGGVLHPQALTHRRRSIPPQNVQGWNLDIAPPGASALGVSRHRCIEVWGHREAEAPRHWGTEGTNAGSDRAPGASKHQGIEALGPKCTKAPRYRGSEASKHGGNRRWFCEGKELENSPDIQILNTGDVHSLIIAEAFEEDTGRYSCFASNFYGTDSISAEIYIEGASSSESEGEPNFDNIAQIQENTSVSLTVSSPPPSAEVVHQDVSPVCSIPVQSLSHQLPTQQMLQDLTAFEGQLIVLECRVKGSPSPKLDWYREGSLIEDSPDFRILQKSLPIWFRFAIVGKRTTDRQRPLRAKEKKA
ncbi:UNVERIFIED_CONTAM: hypothetical protein FKN15_024894 [Acipenser sinensis]